MRIKTLQYTLLSLLCLLTLSGEALSNVAEPQRGESMEIGTVIPEGKDFRIILNQEQLSKVAATQANARRGQPASNDEVQQMIRNDVLRKLRILFPNGFPTGPGGTVGPTSKIKIKITVKLTKPPEFGLSIEW
jgi:hypothetical protein